MGDGESCGTDQDDVEHETSKDPEQGRSIGRGALLLLGLPTALPGVDQKQDAEQSESGRRHHRNDGRSDLGVEGRYRDRHRLPKHDDRQHEHAGADDRFADSRPRPQGRVFLGAAGHVRQARAL